MNNSISSLRTALVGCGGMGRGLMKIVSAMPEFEAVAGCDVAENPLHAFAEQFPQAKTYTDFAQLLVVEQPDVVIIATNNVSHAPLTILAAEAGVSGVYCEKPMAANYADGLKMVEACKRTGTKLVVNHQRRLLPVFKTMRRMMEDGSLGSVELIRAGCAGDMLSDGTHLIDTVRYLAGDAAVKSVFAQIFRDKPDPDAPRGMGYDAMGGWRYGHPVENGAMAVLEFADGLRAEIFTGAMQPKGRRYQDYEVSGTKGRLHRAGDGAKPPLLMQTLDTAGWQPVEIETTDADYAIRTSLELFTRLIHRDEAHPMSGESGLKDLEITMAIYESARQRSRITLPLEQMQYPLDLMIEAGEM